MPWGRLPILQRETTIRVGLLSILPSFRLPVGIIASPWDARAIEPSRRLKIVINSTSLNTCSMYQWLVAPGSCLENDIMGMKFVNYYPKGCLQVVSVWCILSATIGTAAIAMATVLGTRKPWVRGCEIPWIGPARSIVLSVVVVAIV